MKPGAAVGAADLDANVEFNRKELLGINGISLALAGGG